MRILLIASAFAPVVTAHSERAVALARLLRGDGHRVDVVALDTQVQGSSAVDYDPKRYADHVSIVRTGVHGTLKSVRGLGAIRRIIDLVAGYPGPYAHEARQVFGFLKTASNIREYDLVWITTPPHELQLVGFWLARRFGLPYVMDLRDPWADSKRIRHLTPLHRYLSRRWYSRCAAAASALIANTPNHYDLMREMGVSERLFCVPNGYFEADARAAAAESTKRTRSEPVLLYAGNAYRGRVEVALQSLAHEAGSQGLDLTVRVLGFLPRSHLLEKGGRVSPERVVEEVFRSSWLFLYMPAEAEGGPVMSLKAYLYARSGLPVVYMGPDTETLRFLQAHTKVIRHTNPSLTVRALTESLRQPAQGSDTSSRDFAASWEARLPTIRAVLRRAQSTAVSQSALKAPAIPSSR